VSPISDRFLGGRSTPAIRAIILILLDLRSTLTLLVLRIYADNSYNALSMDDLALVAHFFDGCPYFHLISPIPSLTA
jgi:hypothetical protein